MAYLGNQPALSYTSFAKQDFTTSATTSYVLDNPVANANELALFINFVRQEPTTAYTASGTSLTLTSATSASDDMYCVFLGKAVQTVNPPNASVGLSQLTATGTKDATTFLRGDNTFASAGGANTPYCYGELQNSQTISRGVYTKLTGMTYNEIDTNSAFDGTTFTVPSGSNGNYFVIGNIQASFTSIGNDGEQVRAAIYKNGSLFKQAVYYDQAADSREVNIKVSAILSLVATDTIELYARVWDFDSGNASLSDSTNSLTIFKLI
jgi:hypothetical protein